MFPYLCSRECRRDGGAMANNLLHTPDGVRDIYDMECGKKLMVQEKIQQIFYLYGCQSIETPTFEFFDIFNKDRGSVSSGEMFKFFDRDNNTLVLRPDMTPAIARCIAKYFHDETMPLRLCYLERTFLNSSSYQGRLKESTQTGVELIGDDSCDADAEMIAMVIHALKAVGLQDFQVELGQVEFFRGLLQEAGMDEETEDQLRDLIENKNYFGVEELVTAQNMDEDLKQVLLRLPELFGSLEQIREVKKMTGNLRALHAIERLETTWQILKDYGLESYVSFDLGMLSKYKYYTGIIFKAYTYGTGDYVVTGGRYDKLLVQFGKDAPAVGFAIVIDSLLLALARQNILIGVSMVNTMILYDEPAQAAAVRLADTFRSKGMAVQLTRRSLKKNLEDYRDFAKRSHLRNILYLVSAQEPVQAVNVENGEIDLIPLTEYVREE